MNHEDQSANERRALAEHRENLNNIVACSPKTLVDNIRAQRLTTRRRYFFIQERHWQAQDGVYEGPYVCLSRLVDGGFLDPYAAILDHDGVMLATRGGLNYLMIEANGCKVRKLRRYFPRKEGNKKDWELVEIIKDPEM